MFGICQGTYIKGVETLIEKLKSIPKEFRKNGFAYKLLKRAGMCALYSQTNAWGYLVGYEVHKIRKNELSCNHPADFLLMSQGYNCRERLSGNEDFGKFGWSFDSLKEAELKFQELLRREELSND